MISSLKWLAIMIALVSGKKLGPLPTDHVVDLLIGLPLNNQADLEQEIADMHDPSSDNYGKYGNPESFTANYGPTADQIQQITSFLKSHSLTITPRSPTSNLITASGTVSNVNAAFSVDLNIFLDEDGVTYYYASETKAILPAGALGVVGLENRTQISRNGKHKSKQSAQLDATEIKSSKKKKKKSGGSNSDEKYRYNYLSPAAFRDAYSIGTTYTGSGQSGAVFELDTFYQSDITEYVNTFGLPNVPLSIVCLTNVGCPSPGRGVTEVTLDIDLMIATAPGLKEILVYEAPNSIYNGILLYAQIASENRASVISSSWGVPEDEDVSSYFALENTQFMNMAYNGQSMFVASGDSGAFADGKKVGVQDPASQPYVTAVGGTELFMTSSGAYSTETTWWGGSAAKGGGGGGISSYAPIPSYQKISGVINTANSGSTTYRNVPDVSLNAEPTNGYLIYLGNIAGEEPGWYYIGGTSCAAPIWAGYALLINQKLTGEGKPVLGQFNLKIYPLTTSSNYNTYFHDIDDDSKNGYIYKAVIGYDLCTGWGSMNGNALLSAF